MDTTTLPTPEAVHTSEDYGFLLETANSEEQKIVAPSITFTLVISIAGIILNSLVICTHGFASKQKLSTSKMFILYLAVFDLITCGIAIPVDVAVTWKPMILTSPILCKFSKFSNVVCLTASCFVLLFIAIDRFRKVRKPLRWQIGSKTAKKLLVLAIGLGVLLAWPALVLYGKKSFTNPHLNVTTTECDISDTLEDHLYFQLVYVLLFGFLFIVMMVVMSTLYCLIGYEVSKRASKMTSDRQIYQESVYRVSRRSNKKEVPSLYRKRNDEELKDVEDISMQESKKEGETSEACRKDLGPSMWFEENDSSEGIWVAEVVLNVMPDDNKSDRNEEPLSCSVKNSSKNESDIEENPYKPGIEETVQSRVEEQNAVTQNKKNVNVRKTVILMLLAAFGAVFAYVPHLSVYVMQSLKPGFYQGLTNPERAVYRFFYKSFYTNCVLNPIIYNFFDLKFRKSLKELICSALRRQK